PVAQAERYTPRDLLSPLGQLDLSVHAGPILNLLELKTSTWLGAQTAELSCRRVVAPAGLEATPTNRLTLARFGRDPDSSSITAAHRHHHPRIKHEAGSLLSARLACAADGSLTQLIQPVA